MKGQTEAELQMYPVVLGTGSRVPRQQKADMLNSAVLRSRAPGAQTAKSLALFRLPGKNAFDWQFYHSLVAERLSHISSSEEL